MRSGLLAVVLATSTLAACSGSDATTPTSAAPAGPVPVDATAATTTIAPNDDGVLRLGVLAPETGPDAAIGLSIEAAVQYAVELINDAGGVGGTPVRVHLADEGADIATATSSIDELLKANVDAIIGPSSSTVALDLLDILRREQVVTCSPTATSMALDEFPDDGLFFRTAPSDALEAEAIARAIDQTGRSSVGLLYADDAYGRPFAERLRAALTVRSITITASVPYSAVAASYDGSVASVLDADVVAVIGALDSGSRVVAAVAAASAGSDAPIVVSDALRALPGTATFGELDPSAIERLIAVGPRVSTDNQEFTDAVAAKGDGAPLFAANAYDCVNLLALAAYSAESARPQELAGRIPSIAISGSRCTTFADCAAGLAAGRNVDYDGPSGLLQLAFDGDPNRGSYDVVGFADDGSERSLGILTVNV